MRESWVSRIGIIYLVIVFTEIIAWHRGATYDVLDWLLVILINSTLTVLVLDLVVRWYSGLWVTILLASGLFGMLHGAIVTLAIQTDLPLSLVIFGTGMPTLMVTIAFVSFYVLYGGQAVPVYWWITIPLIGLMHGLWLRWLPSLDEINIEVAALETVLPLSVILLAATAVLVYVLPLPTQIEREEWLLTPIERTLVSVPLIGLIATRIESNELDTFPFLLAVVVAFILIALMWFFQSLAPRPVFKFRFQPNNLLVIRWLVSLIPFGGAAWLGYELPGDSNSPQFIGLFATIITFGILWPPVISIFISVQAFIELSRQEY